MKTSHRWAALPLQAATLLAALATLAGCAASSPAPVLLTLPPAVTGAALPAAGAGRVLALRRVDIPEYLTARRVRYRADASTLAEWPDTFWAERIEIGVSREFASALRQQLPDWRLCDASCSDQAPALAVQVEMTQLDFVRSQRRLVSRARFTLWSTERTPQLLRSEERAYELPVEADTPQAHAQAMTDLIRRAAADAAPMVAAARP